MPIRTATATDLPDLLGLLQLKAEFDGCPEALKATPEKLKATLFCDRPMAYILLVETLADATSQISTSQIPSRSVGFASYHFTYSTFLAQPSLWLDDLFIKDVYRNQALGTHLMRSLCQIAHDHGCGRIDWTVDVNNAAGIRFYQRMGGQLQTHVSLCRLDQLAIAAALSSNS
ncbi:MAG: GNAT family N-acetyltransferase [Phormidesmis sp.]